MIPVRGARGSGRRHRPVGLRLLHVAGWLIAGSGMALVLRALILDWPDVAEAVGAGARPWLLLAVVVAVGAMFVIALAWKVTLRLLQGRWPIGPISSWYFLGELGKYLPGAIWSIVGRAELAARGGVPRRTAYGSAFVGLAATYGCAAVIILVLLPLQPGILDRWPWLVAAPLFVPVLLLALHPGVLPGLWGRAAGSAGPATPTPLPRWSAIVGLVVMNLPAWLGIGLATWCVGMAVGLDASFNQVLFASTLSWFMGFVVVPAPGGLGVREAVFVWAIPAPTLAVPSAVALVARFTFILADAAGAGIAAFLARNERRDGVEVRDPGAGTPLLGDSNDGGWDT